ncbi:hypothetical protein F5884DRAFT_168301 [Xylogone sp. PMI_703]|nr:hypothetical protein F5884DRAFT_168301 [Xylogone sp. PMI_703]
MSCQTEVEINASPEEVKAVFFDFPRWPEWRSVLVRSISRLPGHEEGPIKVGEKLDVNFSGLNTKVVVTANNDREFSWRGDLLFVLSGDHSHIFEPSTKTPGGTTFRNNEVYARFNTVLMRLVPPNKMFQQFCEDLKNRVESLKK